MHMNIYLKILNIKKIEFFLAISILWVFIDKMSIFSSNSSFSFGPISMSEMNGSSNNKSSTVNTVNNPVKTFKIEGSSKDWTQAELDEFTDYIREIKKSNNFWPCSSHLKKMGFPINQTTLVNLGFDPSRAPKLTKKVFNIPDNPIIPPALKAIQNGEVLEKRIPVYYDKGDKKGQFKEWSITPGGWSPNYTREENSKILGFSNNGNTAPQPVTSNVQSGAQVATQSVAVPVAQTVSMIPNPFYIPDGNAVFSMSGFSGMLHGLGYYGY